MSNQIETKEIGIDIGVGIGTFVNTEYVNGSIQLKQKIGQINNKPVYEVKGYWESEVIDLKDRFREYKNVALKKTQKTKDICSIETRVSDDGINFDDYIPTTHDGRIQSDTKRFIQVKINFFAGLTEEFNEIAKFDSDEKTNEWENNMYIDTSNGLRLKRNYEFVMNEDSTWSEEGFLYRKKIIKEHWKKIDSLGVE